MTCVCRRANLQELLADGEHAVELRGGEGAVQEEAAHDVGEALPEEGGEEHQLVVEHED